MYDIMELNKENACYYPKFLFSTVGVQYLSDTQEECNILCFMSVYIHTYYKADVSKSKSIR